MSPAGESERWCEEFAKALDDEARRDGFTGFAALLCEIARLEALLDRNRYHA